MSELDPHRRRKFIIERILNPGEIEDFRWVVKFYGEEDVKSVLIQSHRLDARSRHFWRHYFNIDLSQCTNNSSIQRQTELLEALGSVRLMNQFYLAGGTAIALHLGHRRSIDLDFFTVDEFAGDDLKAALSKTAKLKVL